jgi:hypothetical protein
MMRTTKPRERERKESKRKPQNGSIQHDSPSRTIGFKPLILHRSPKTMLVFVTLEQVEHLWVGGHGRCGSQRSRLRPEMERTAVVGRD